MNLTLHLTRCIKRYADRTALVYHTTRMTYREMGDQINRLANGLLALGLKKGDRVALLSANRMELVLAEYAAYKAGLAGVPLNARLSMPELVHMLNNSQASVLVIGPEHIDSFEKVRPEIKGLSHVVAITDPRRDMLAYEDLINASASEPKVEINLNDLCSLRYTSGTTGVLKAAMHSHKNRLASAKKRLLIPGVDIGPDSVVCHTGPVTHASGSLVLPIWWAGGCNLILDGFDPGTLLGIIEQERVSHMFAAPTMLNMLMNFPDIHKYDLSSIKTIFYGAAPMPVPHLKRALEFFGPVFIQSYGQTETASVIASLLKTDHVLGEDPIALKRLASCGTPNALCEVRVVNTEGEDVRHGEIGEVISRGEDSMMGYWRDPELTGQTLINGWVHTRDMATVDDDGYIYIVDRKSDMIISGGFNVYPTEVENALLAHPAVFEAAVIGVPDDLWGESVKACVVLKPDARATAEELIAHCKEQLSSYKKPKSVEFMMELPKNATGKLMRQRLKEKYWMDTI